MQNIRTSPATGGLARLYRGLWTHAGSDRPLVVLFMAMQIGAVLVKLAIPYFSAEAMNALQRSGADGLREAGSYLALTFAAALVSWMLHGPARVIERFVAVRVRGRFTDAVYAKLTSLPMGWHARRHSGETIQRVSKAAAALFGFSQTQFIYLQNAVNLIGPIVALCIVSALTGAVAVVGYLAIVLVLLRFDRVMIELARAENRAERRFLATLVDCLGNISTVLTLRLQEPTRRLVNTRLAEVFAPLRRSVVVNEAKWCAVDLLNNAIRCGLVALYGWLAWREGGAVMLGTALLVHQYAQQAGAVIGTMATHYQELVRFQTDFGEAEGIVREAESRPPAPVGEDWREIRIDGLSFGYPGGPAGHGGGLAGVGLTLTRGRRIALIGESGSGKSTVMRLLAGLYQPDRAEFRVDGVLRPELPHLGAVATLIPQEPEIFESTLGHNVTLGLDYDEADVARAVALAELGPVLARLPAGLDTAIEERGANLSGGQRQRLALARGILAARGSGLIMLDEPTSSLDPATEARLYDAVLAEFPDACVVSSVHRLHLLDRFDMVVLMAEGRVVDQGSVDELLQRQPGFRMLWQAQLGRPSLAA
ncbi:ABC transporter ATP-binding protein [Arenibaculum pallidiluteum]|uniref:ABC transporter ATP-binding protein n=1 Tax=Arenibaculum pallidiluteum TaxID=2812559 RepID=UPI001A95B633|nr:ABC transporter ATP-binding protein [Arenibaculum pallidiluteum]